MLASLAEGRISLSVAGRLAPHLVEENAQRLLQDGAGMSKRAVEEYLVALKPKPTFDRAIDSKRVLDGNKGREKLQEEKARGTQRRTLPGRG